MRGGHVEIVLELFVGDNRGQVPGQGLVQLVVDSGVGLSVVGRDEQEDEQHHNGPVVPEDKGVHPVKAGKKASVLVLGDLLIENQHKARQYQNHGGYAQHHALGHDDANVPPQCQPHDAQGQEACDGGYAGGGQGAERGNNGGGHGVPVIRIVGPLLLVAVVEENGVVHGDA